MQNLSKMFRPLTIAGLVAGMLVTSPGTARGDEHKTNACGCYANTAGECTCTRKVKCGCPGECEPKGCEEKRQKELEKEIKEETKKPKMPRRSGKKKRPKKSEKLNRQAAAKKSRGAAEAAELRKAEETGESRPSKRGSGES